MGEVLCVLELGYVEQEQLQLSSVLVGRLSIWICDMHNSSPTAAQLHLLSATKPSPRLGLGHYGPHNAHSPSSSSLPFLLFIESMDSKITGTKEEMKSLTIWPLIEGSITRIS